MDLVAWPRAEFENLAVGGANKRRDNGGVFIGDKTIGCIKCLVCRCLG
jgi:hypothetical protein